MRRAAVRCSAGIGALKNPAYFVLDEVSQALAAPRATAHRFDNALGGRDADVGREQQLLERLDGVDVDRTRSLLRLVGALDDLLEPIDDLLFGAAEPVA